MRAYDQKFPRSAWEYLALDGVGKKILEVGYIAHFQFKSERDFERRVARGGFPNQEIWGELVRTGRYKALLERLNVVYDDYLARYWLGKKQDAFDIRPRAGRDRQRRNLALRRPSFQSSVYQPTQSSEPAHARLAGHGNDGVRTGTYGFHTQFEDSPWWMVDLLNRCLIDEVRVYNRTDDPQCARRAAHVVLEVSEDSANWQTAYDFSEQAAATPTEWSARLPVPRTARFIRLRSRTPTFLHLDEIEVYGEAVPPE
jgi:hypothetical protein